MVSKVLHPVSRSPGLAARLAFSLAAVLLLGAEGALPYNGFSLEGLQVPKETIVSGGPGRDGIKSVDAPAFAPPDGVDWVAPQNPVLGVALGGEAHAYPVHVMEYHQIVNDTLGGAPVLLSYDPIAGTPLAYRRLLSLPGHAGDSGGKLLTFGVSGLLYNANFLLYDRETESLWSQFEGRAIAGPLAGKRLARLPVRQETFAQWLGRHPESSVLERPFPKRIDYRYSPFARYWIRDEIPYPVRARDTSHHAKEVVVGIVVKGAARAYLGSRVTAAGGHVVDEFQGAHIELRYDSDDAVFSWTIPPGTELTEAYWFAWKAFHPDTDLWAPPAAPHPPAPGSS